MGVCLMLGTAALASRLVWERTLLSWERGPQMIGFALAHGSGIGLLLFPPLLVLWLAFAIIRSGWSFWRMRKVAKSSVGSIACGLAVLSALLPSQGFWIRVFPTRFAQCPHGPDFMITAAAEGDVGAVKALLDHGIPADARNREGKTALYCAAVGGSSEIARFLISRGADVNAISLWGDSPLAVAIAEGHEDTAALLRAHGAIRVQGTEEQRKRAAEEIVRADMAEMASKRAGSPRR
ncbi:MAG TPA: ankyrin repeat domain-containing protein [Opitutus sp.]|nr:ankyrin repeat domain-containing protein [Opitutus sp.]